MERKGKLSACLESATWGGVNDKLYKQRHYFSTSIFLSPSDTDVHTSNGGLVVFFFPSKMHLQLRFRSMLACLACAAVLCNVQGKVAASRSANDPLPACGWLLLLAMAHSLQKHLRTFPTCKRRCYYPIYCFAAVLGAPSPTDNANGGTLDHETKVYMCAVFSPCGRVPLYIAATSFYYSAMSTAKCRSGTRRRFCGRMTTWWAKMIHATCTSAL